MNGPDFSVRKLSEKLGAKDWEKYLTIAMLPFIRAKWLEKGRFISSSHYVCASLPA